MEKGEGGPLLVCAWFPLGILDPPSYKSTCVSFVAPNGISFLFIFFAESGFQIRDESQVKNPRKLTSLPNKMNGKLKKIKTVYIQLQIF